MTTALVRSIKFGAHGSVMRMQQYKDVCRYHISRSLFVSRVEVQRRLYTHMKTSRYRTVYVFGVMTRFISCECYKMSLFNRQRCFCLIQLEVVPFTVLSSDAVSPVLLGITLRLSAFPVLDWTLSLVAAGNIAFCLMSSALQLSDFHLRSDAVNRVVARFGSPRWWNSVSWC